VDNFVTMFNDDIERRLEVLEQTLNLYRLHGLDVMRTRNISYHPVPYADAVPTEKGAQGEPRLVETGGARYIYFNIDGGTTWEGVVLS
jgi:hypothetical protein